MLKAINNNQASCMMLKKIRKLLLHPNLYFYDYIRKKLRFKKYFVTDKIRLLDVANHQKWFKLLFTHPYLYLYYKLNKALGNPKFPVLVDYRIESMEDGMVGGGKRVVLAVELERGNIIYFADPGIVQKALANKDPYLAGIISRFNFKGNENRVFLGGCTQLKESVKINMGGASCSLIIDGQTTIDEHTIIELSGQGNSIRICKHSYIGSSCKLTLQEKNNVLNMAVKTKLSKKSDVMFKGNNNCLSLGIETIFEPNCSISFAGANNALYTGKSCRLLPYTKINLKKNCNCIYLGDETKVDKIADLKFYGNNSLIYFCGKSPVTAVIQIWSNSIFFSGYASTFGGDKYHISTLRLQEQKNIILGSATMLARGCYCRNCDGHLLYDAKTKKRINHSKSIIIGNNSWIGQHSFISKGSMIHDGATIGANSLISNKTIPANCIAAGSPIKILKQDIIIDSKFIGNFLHDDTIRYDVYQCPDMGPQKISFDKLIQIDSIEPTISSKEKIKCIKNIIGE